MRGFAYLTFGLAFLALGPKVAAQHEIDIHAIESWAKDLRSGDESRLNEAVQRLSHLPASALPAIETRLGRTRRQIVPEEDGYDALRYFRHAVGSRRADDDVDIAPGISSVLLERPSPAVGRSAERLLILRSLETLGTSAAQRLMGDVLALTPTMWRWERRRLLSRMGRRLLPGLLWLRGHREPSVRRWARASIEQLQLDDPGRSVQNASETELAELFEAYAAMRIMDAMPVIISYVGHDEEGVRVAARAAMERYGQNGIWQLREAMRNQLGEEADRSWGWRRTAEVLFEGLDTRRLGPVTVKLEEGLRAIHESRWDDARSLFDDVLLHAPEHPRRNELAAPYATIAEHSTDDDAEALLQRAHWLDPDDGDIKTQLDLAQNARLAALGIEIGAPNQNDAAVQDTPVTGTTESGSDVSWITTLLVLFSLALLAFGAYRALRTSRRTSEQPINSVAAKAPTLDTAWRTRLGATWRTRLGATWRTRLGAMRPIRHGWRLTNLARWLNPHLMNRNPDWARRSQAAWKHVRRFGSFWRAALGSQGQRLIRFLRLLHAGDDSGTLPSEPGAFRRPTRLAEPQHIVPTRKEPTHRTSSRASFETLLTQPRNNDATLPGNTSPVGDDTPLDIAFVAEDAASLPWMAATQSSTSPGAVDAPDTLPG